MKVTPFIKSSFAVLAVAAVVLSPLSVVASTTVTANMTVTATVQATCIVSTTAMAFGTYTGVASTGAATVLVTCTNSTPYTLGLSAGSGTSATVTNRSMTLGAASLKYALYSDSARSVNFDVLTGLTGSGAQQTINVYGAVSAAQYVAPGAYGDTIVASVTY